MYIYTGLAVAGISLVYEGLNSKSFFTGDHVKTAALLGVTDIASLYLMENIFPEWILLGDSRIAPSLISGVAFAGAEKYRHAKDSLMKDFAYGAIISGVGNYATLGNRSHGVEEAVYSTGLTQSSGTGSSVPPAH